LLYDPEEESLPLPFRGKEEQRNRGEKLHFGRRGKINPSPSREERFQHLKRTRKKKDWAWIIRNPGRRKEENTPHDEFDSEMNKEKKRRDINR